MFTGTNPVLSQATAGSFNGCTRELLLDIIRVIMKHEQLKTFLHRNRYYWGCNYQSKVEVAAIVL